MLCSIQRAIHRLPWNQNSSIEPNSSNAARLHVAVCLHKNMHGKSVARNKANEQLVQGSRHQHNPSFEQNSGTHRRTKSKPRRNHQVHSISPETVKNEDNWTPQLLKNTHHSSKHLLLLFLLPISPFWRCHRCNATMKRAMDANRYQTENAGKLNLKPDLLHSLQFLHIGIHLAVHQ